MCETCGGLGFAPRRNPGIYNPANVTFERAKQRAEARKVARQEMDYQQLLSKKEQGVELSNEEKMRLAYYKGMIAAEKMAKLGESTVCYMA